METISIVLILLGIALLVAEIFIPSFGVTGVLGIISIIGGIVFTAETVAEGMIMFMIILVIVLVLMFLAYRFIASKRSPLVLKEIVNEDDSDNDLVFFIDKEGVALTTLRPSGKGDFDGVRLDVITVGNFIKKNQKIVVTRVEGKKIFVSELKVEGE
jgi:membrane-bound ClpP family serine protease